MDGGLLNLVTGLHHQGHHTVVGFGNFFNSVTKFSAAQGAQRVRGWTDKLRGVTLLFGGTEITAAMKALAAEDQLGASIVSDDLEQMEDAQRIMRDTMLSSFVPATQRCVAVAAVTRLRVC